MSLVDKADLLRYMSAWTYGARDALGERQPRWLREDWEDMPAKEGYWDAYVAFCRPWEFPS